MTESVWRLLLLMFSFLFLLASQCIMVLVVLCVGFSWRVVVLVGNGGFCGSSSFFVAYCYWNWRNWKVQKNVLVEVLMMRSETSLLFTPSLSSIALKCFSTFKICIFYSLKDNKSAFVYFLIGCLQSPAKNAVIWLAEELTRGQRSSDLFRTCLPGPHKKSLTNKLPLWRFQKENVECMNLCLINSPPIKESSTKNCFSTLFGSIHPHLERIWSEVITASVFIYNVAKI